MTSSRLIVNAKVGNKEPLHSSSVGKCLLAFSPPQTVEQILQAPLEKFTDKTITSKEKLLEELEKIRQQGYAIDDGEITEEIRCIAVPIFNHRREANYSLGVSGPSGRMKAYKLKTIASALMRAGNAISAQLGYVN
jgi:DNA-binding IclR family transcriptional regulator